MELLKLNDNLSLEIKLEHNKEKRRGYMKLMAKVSRFITIFCLSLLHVPWELGLGTWKYASCMVITIIITYKLRRIIYRTKNIVPETKNIKTK